MSRRLWRVLAAAGPTCLVETDGVYHAVVGDIFGDWSPGGEQGKPLPLEPLLFLKPSTAVVGPGDAIALPPGVGRVDHEAELAVVIGARATRVAEADAMAYVLGLTCMNDVTARDIQKKDGRYTRAKGFDTFAPLGPCIALDLAPDDLRVTGMVNGVVRQDSRTRELIFPVARLISAISHIMTLLPGDVVSTGTPAGIGPLHPGDEVAVTVEGVGTLHNIVSVVPPSPVGAHPGA